MSIHTFWWRTKVGFSYIHLPIAMTSNHAQYSKRISLSRQPRFNKAVRLPNLSLEIISGHLHSLSGLFAS